MIERVFQASKLTERLHDLLGRGQAIEGGCALVTAVAGSSCVKIDKIPPLEQFHEDILTLRERRHSKSHHCPKKSDTDELLERLSNGQARIIGAWPVDPEDGWFIDDAAKNPTAVIRDLLDGEEGEKILREEKVTAVMISQTYRPKPGQEEKPVGHVLAVIPDQRAFSRNMRAKAKKVERNGQGTPHLLVDITVRGSESNPPGVTVATGNQIAEYVTSPHSKKGTPQALLHFILTKK